MTGFTLTEILVTLAIIGILTAIALPSYQNSQLRSARADGKNALMQAASDQERFYAGSFTYSTNAGPLENPAVEDVTSPDGNYVISITDDPCDDISSCFTATATPQGGQVDDDCGNLTITNTGLRGASGGTVEECWQR